MCMFDRTIFRISFFFAFINSEILPLVEFTPEDDIPEQEVERLLLAPPKSNMEQIDPFVDTMINEEVSDILPLTLDRDALRALEPTTILIAKGPPPLKTRYYRNLMPEWLISMCPECLQVRLSNRTKTNLRFLLFQWFAAFEQNNDNVQWDVVHFEIQTNST